MACCYLDGRAVILRSYEKPWNAPQMYPAEMTRLRMARRAPEPPACVTGYAAQQSSNGGRPIDPTVVIAWRETMGYTPTDAADALGCSRTSIYNWENGTNECPHYIGLAMAALAMGMSPYGSNGGDKDANNKGGAMPVRMSPCQTQRRPKDSRCRIRSPSPAHGSAKLRTPRRYGMSGSTARRGVG
jgi:DNA-binding XRE family transcriptional regulator